MQRSKSSFIKTTTNSITKNQSENIFTHYSKSFSLYIFFTIAKLHSWWNNQCYHPNSNPSSSLSVTARHMSWQTHDSKLTPPVGHSYSPPPPQPLMHSATRHSNLSSSCSRSSFLFPSSFIFKYKQGVLC